MDEPRRLTHEDYTVACICPMGVELAPLEAMLDETHPSLCEGRDLNTYTLGRMGVHNVVIAVLPEIGNNSAAIVATQLLNDFKSIRFGLLVGIGGGIPSDENDIRLGDVVVSMPVGTFGGVVQLDRGKIHSERRFERTGTLNKPPKVLLANVHRLQARHKRFGTKIHEYLSQILKEDPKLGREGYVYPGVQHDQLYKAGYVHKTGKSCQQCDPGEVVQRGMREDITPIIHYGTIGSANKVIKDSETRDKLRQDLGILCVEMEAAGLVDDFPCLVIRGICDYADSHKNKVWQPHAAAVAAAYAKELLSVIPAQEVVKIDKASDVALTVKGTPLEQSLALEKRNARKNLLTYLSSYNHEYAHYQLSKRRQDGTGTWILQNAEFNVWWKSTSGSIWCSGIPGAGKTILTTFVIDEAKKLSSKHAFPVAYVYCDKADSSTLMASSVLGSLVKQLLFHLDRLKLTRPSMIMDKLELGVNQGRTHFFAPEIAEMLLQSLSCFDKAVFFVDGLDECAPDESRQILESLERLVRDQGTQLLVFIASREEIDVSRFLSECSHVSVSEDNVASDIRSYVDREVEINIVEEGRTSSISIIQDIKSSLIKGSQGMFLWVALQIQAIIADCNTDEQMQESLRRLPTSLAETYLLCLLRIPKRRRGDLGIAPNILKWVAFSSHPLSMDELKEAIAFTSDDVKWSDSKVPNTISNCGNLVVFEDDGSVRLAHSTVRQYLLSEKQPSEVVNQISLEEQRRILERFNFKQEQAELEIGEVCVTYLSFSDFGDRKVREAEIRDFKVPNVVPPIASFQALGAPGLGRILNKAFPRSSQSKKIITVSQTDIVPSGTFSKYKLLEYAKTHWTLNTTYITKKSPVWGKFKSLALVPNRSWNLQPWVKDDHSEDSYYKCLFQWALGAQHIPLLALLDYAPSGQKLSNFAKQLSFSGYSPLHYAADNNLDRVAKVLLRNCKVNAKDGTGRTALHCAADRGHTEVVQVLLMAREIKIDVRTNDNETPLIRAALGGHVEIVQMLLQKGADIEAKDIDRQTILHKTAAGGHEALVKLLLENGADIEAKDADGSTALNEAARFEQVTVVKLLLENGADIKAKDKYGLTTLRRAVESGHEAVVKLLLENGADIKAKDIERWTTLQRAAQFGQVTVVKLLLENGANIEAKDIDGWTALHRAAKSGDKAVVKLLLENGANIEAKDINGWTALRRAVESGNKAVVKLLVENGADIEAKGIDRWTALHRAAAGGHEAVVKLLLENGADIEAKDVGGWTALHAAARFEQVTVVKLLLENGADIEVKEFYGETPSDVALTNRHDNVVEMLYAAKLDRMRRMQ